MCEHLGGMWFGIFAGAVVVEATKQIYAAKPAVERLKQRRRVLLRMPGTPSPPAHRPAKSESRSLRTGKSQSPGP